ncbi:pyridoxamine 5'-phosphate oxidase [Pelagibacterium nitratireducens]|uniref:pyridoxamine 5'-phosphate oxidase n=1 Tax=Pelagibacterium nitratireducens TaxID=1046114 RepID=UPI003BB19792|tara:strand:- start:3162 stop:3803 length:642 start_codon:yes stop_codon:yes gene_type:complete
MDFAVTASLTDLLFDDAYDGAIDPLELFPHWLEEARETEPNDPNAMALASVDETGMPDLRMVLLNGYSHQGFVFFTNFESAKGRELLANPRAALLFHWKSLRRQVRVRGPVQQVPHSDADAYFASRPAQSRIGAHASDQSRPLESRNVLVERVATLTEKFADGEIGRPAHWSGFRVTPLQIEFWKDGAFRLHDRVVFTRPDPESDWSRTRLFP